MYQADIIQDTVEKDLPCENNINSVSNQDNPVGENIL